MMRQIPLSEILTESQIQDLRKIYNQEIRMKRQPHKALHRYIETCVEIKTKCEKNSVLTDYFAYVLEHLFNQATK